MSAMTPSDRSEQHTRSARHERPLPLPPRQRQRQAAQMAQEESPTPEQSSRRSARRVTGIQAAHAQATLAPDARVPVAVDAPILSEEERRDAEALGDDMTRMTLDRRARWTQALDRAYAALSAPPQPGEPLPTVPLIDRSEDDALAGARASDIPIWTRTPVTVRALARAMGLSLRMTRYLLLNANWRLEEVAAPPVVSHEHLTPEQVLDEYLSVPEVAAALDVSRSHIYGMLRRRDVQVRTTTMGGMLFILREDLPKIHLLRDRRRK